MVTIVNSDIKQTYEEIEEQHPNCMYVVRQDDIFEDAGYLVMYNDSAKTNEEFIKYMREFRFDKVAVLGHYAEETEYLHNCLTVSLFEYREEV